MNATLALEVAIRQLNKEILVKANEIGAISLEKRKLEKAKCEEVYNGDEAMFETRKSRDIGRFKRKMEQIKFDMSSLEEAKKKLEAIKEMIA